MLNSFTNFLESKKSNIIYEDETGYIKGYLRKDGYWWIEELVIYLKLRGKGLAKKLASHIPQKSKLLAYPLLNLKGRKLSKDQLINFYISLGFKEKIDEYGNSIMYRD